MNTTKVILITGGAGGIGKAIAEKFVRKGHTVIIADREEVHRAGRNMYSMKVGVGKRKDVDKLHGWVTENFGTPDILILNAGQGIREKLTEGDPDHWQEIINTNLMGPLRLIRSFVPGMLQRKKGEVIFISSVSAGKSYPSGGIYAASKTALEIVAETLRLETLPLIKVTTISPGITDTGFFSNCIGGHQSVEEMGMGALSPEEIAEDVFYSTTRKNGSSINKIITRPIWQAF